LADDASRDRGADEADARIFGRSKPSSEKDAKVIASDWGWRRRDRRF
jgi:hypothetical protein